MSVALMKGLHSCPMDPLVFIFCPYTVSAGPCVPPPRRRQTLPDTPRLMCRTVGGVGAHSRAGEPGALGLFARRNGSVQHVEVSIKQRGLLPLAADRFLFPSRSSEVPAQSKISAFCQ